MKKLLIISFCCTLFSCSTTVKDGENINDLYNLDIARELGLCFDELRVHPADSEINFPVCSEGDIRIFFLEPNYYLSYVSFGGWCGSCGCHATLYKKEQDEYIEIDGYACCYIDLEQPNRDYIIIKDGIKASYCWPGFSGKFKVKNDMLYLDEIIEYRHQIINIEEHPDSCEYQDSSWVFN